jgi:hypothetical protein
LTDRRNFAGRLPWCRTRAQAAEDPEHTALARSVEHERAPQVEVEAKHWQLFGQDTDYFNGLAVKHQPRTDGIPPGGHLRLPERMRHHRDVVTSPARLIGGKVSAQDRRHTK